MLSVSYASPLGLYVLNLPLLSRPLTGQNWSSCLPLNTSVQGLLDYTVSGHGRLSKQGVVVLCNDLLVLKNVPNTTDSRLVSLRPCQDSTQLMKEPLGRATNQRRKPLWLRSLMTSLSTAFARVNRKRSSWRTFNECVHNNGISPLSFCNTANGVSSGR
jgi:hypothetical protein